MSFKDILGHDSAIAALQEYIKQGRLSNAYLFSGPAGIGKHLVAKTLAKALNCENQTLDSCDKCSSCLRINNAQHPDAHFIGVNEEDWVKIDYIRQLQRDISLRPYEARKKVFIIDQAHKLTAEAANALLKILEEPPQHSLIILITSKSALLFKTVISRCSTLKFYPVRPHYLEEVLKKDYSLHNHLAHFLAYFCEGRMGEALSLKGADILNRKNRVIDEFVFSARAAVTPGQVTDSDLRIQLNMLAAWFRDIYLLKAGLALSQAINLDRKVDLLKTIQKFSYNELDGILKAISDSLFFLERNINIKLLKSNLREAIGYGTRN